MPAPLRVVPLGGLGEIGQNMLALEYGNDCIVIDAGVLFPEEEMLGVDLVIPNVSYLKQHREKLRGIVITHGHEDHIGALPYILPDLRVPVFAPPLAKALIDVRLQEHGLKDLDVRRVQIGEQVRLGAFRVEWFRVTHSIPDAAGLAIRTPLGLVVHTGDFKIDHTPWDGKQMDLARLAQFGNEGVFLLFSDSTYAERPGYTPSEQVVARTLDRLIAEAPGRVLVATFASLISRAQMVLDAAARYGRRVFVFGRSMVGNVEMALQLGYLVDHKGVLAPQEELRRTPPEKTLVLATGAQGEPSSALARIASRDHRQLKIQKGDTVIVSASPIPGNDRLVAQTLDRLFQQGAQVYYSRVADVHVPGHAGQEEMKLVLALTRPRYFVPVHGEYRHLILHTQLAQSMGVPPERTFALQDGDVLELTPEKGQVVQRVEVSPVYVDGIGDVGPVVLRDRQQLSRDGVLVVILMFDKRTGRLVGQPDLVSRGFVEEENGVLADARRAVQRAVDHAGQLGDPGYLHMRIKEVLSQHLFSRTRRRPMILPITLEV